MLYPQIEPYRHGFLDTGDGHQIYWELCGNPRASRRSSCMAAPAAAARRCSASCSIPACTTCCCSTSAAAAAPPHASLEHNTTWHLVADIERLRTEIMGADKWLVFGGSWGSTLSLAYAETHPAHVSELVLRHLHGAQRRDPLVLPGRRVIPVPGPLGGIPGADPASRARRPGAGLSQAPDRRRPVEQLRAAKAWSKWEDSTITLLPSPRHQQSHAADRAALAFARIENHYFVNAGFMEEGQLIRDACKLRGIPGTIIQGRYDVCTPARTAWDLHRAWPEAEFHLVPDSGHAFDEPGTLARLIAATDAYAKR